MILKAHTQGLFDVLVNAPTGSGKTLAYALPILHALSSRVVPRLRALVLLPTRDLALQVKAVFDPFCAELGLRVSVQRRARARERLRTCADWDLILI